MKKQQDLNIGYSKDKNKHLRGKSMKMNKKGMLWAMTHPIGLLIIGLIIGALLMYYLLAKGIIPVH